jgi:hypothetical protein
MYDVWSIYFFGLFNFIQKDGLFAVVMYENVDVMYENVYGLKLVLK